MITVLKVNKQGNKIVSYTCTNGDKTVDLSKEQLSEYIDKKTVINATKQMYKGTLIIRVKDAAKTSNKQKLGVKNEANIIDLKTYLMGLDKIVLLSYQENSSVVKLSVSKKATNGIDGSPMMYGMTINEIQDRNNECCTDFIINKEDTSKSYVRQYYFMNMYNRVHKDYNLKEWIEEDRSFDIDIRIKIVNKLKEKFNIQ